ncbi:LexA family transcriptional regulator [uncultured Rikenella sp.]|nr:LexA family transcriptional regulator [uncultured Rikenella sp.]
MTIKDRIEIFIENQHIKRSVFEKSCGFSNGYTRNLKGSPSASKIEDILNSFPELNRVWLLTGEGNMLKADATKSNTRLIGEAYSASQRDADVSLVDFIPVSAHASFIEDYPCAAEFDQLPVILKSEEKADIESLKIFEVEGDSMIPTIQPGAMVLTKLIPECRWHYAEGVVVAAYDDFVVLKRVIRNELLTSNRIILGSDNERYGEMTVAAADLRAMFKAKRILSQDIY